MANLSFTQLEALWEQAGGAPALAPVMAAIALAESSGNPTSTNPTDNGGTQTSWGLWQISDGTHNPPPNWSDPAGNAQLAVAKEKSQGLSAWGTYDSGAYLHYLGGGSAASPGNSATLASYTTTGATAGGGQAGAPYTPSVVPGVPSTPPPAPDFTLNPVNEAGRIVSWIGEFGAWALFIVLIFLLGLLLLLLGLVMLALVFTQSTGVGGHLSAAEDVIGGGIVGRMTKGTKKGVTSAGRSSGPSPDVLAERARKADQAAEERQQMTEARASDRRSDKIFGPGVNRARPASIQRSRSG